MYYVYLYIMISVLIEMPPVCEGLNFTFTVTVLTAADIMTDIMTDALNNDALNNDINN